MDVCKSCRAQLWYVLSGHLSGLGRSPRLGYHGAAHAACFLLLLLASCINPGCATSLLQLGGKSGVLKQPLAASCGCRLFRGTSWGLHHQLHGIPFSAMMPRRHPKLPADDPEAAHCPAQNALSVAEAAAGAEACLS